MLQIINTTTKNRERHLKCLLVKDNNYIRRILCGVYLDERLRDILELSMNVVSN